MAKQSRIKMIKGLLVTFVLSSVVALGCMLYFGLNDTGAITENFHLTEELPLDGYSKIAIESIMDVEIIPIYGESRAEFRYAYEGISLPAPNYELSQKIIGDTLQIELDYGNQSKVQLMKTIQSNPKLTIYLPTSMMDGQIELLEIEASAGEIKIDGTYQEIIVVSNIGDIDIQGEFSKLKVEQQAGRLTVAAEKEAVIEAVNHVGDIDIRGMINQASLRGDVAEIYIESDMMPERLVLESNVGDIVLRIPSDTVGFTANIPKELKFMGNFHSDFDVMYKETGKDVVAVFGDGAAQWHFPTTGIGEIRIKRK